MVVISEISDVDDPNKRPKELQKKPKELEKKPKEVQKKLKEKVLYSLPIPDALIVSCFARIKRCHYPTLSLVSSPFYQLISSPELYLRRSLLGCTECVLYAYIGFPPPENPTWYFLRRKPYRNLPNTFSLKLGKIDSLPPIPQGSAVVTVGSNIYVIGGSIGETSIRCTTNVTLIDCVSHKYSSLPRMKVGRCHAAAGVIDGKIYVIGGCEMRSLDWVEVFDIKNQTWSQTIWPTPIPTLTPVTEFVTYVVMEEMIYMTNNLCTYAYNPKKACVKSWGRSLSLFWQDASCVVDGMLFILNLHDALMVHYPIHVYEPKEGTWRHLKGLEGFPANILVKESKMVDFGGKLMILGPGQSRLSKYDGKKEIWCVEIGLEREQGGRIWGMIESVAVVLTPLTSPSVELCQTVMV